MRIEFRFRCVNMVPGAGDGTGEITPGATIGQALAEYTFSQNLDVPLEALYRSMYLIGTKPARKDDVLKDGDVLTILHPLQGG